MNELSIALPLELWGGLECTVNRVGRAYHDQLVASGHARRLDDLDRIAELGIRTLRYPVLWERTAPRGLEQADWAWADERLARLRELGVQPIAGLVHHGSGPRYTNLLDPKFPEKLAAYAHSVAERYPWIDRYTPVNEPLTTARFSALYGHWYPHRRDGASFARALLNQCRAVVLAMRAIREVNPDAQLIQTEDLGRTHSTRRLVYQAEFENERRWVTWDLLCGRVDREHRMWDELCSRGIAEGELEWFLETPCPPDVIGINYYLTSERFLDHRLDRYPERTHGKNKFETYADVAAVRVSARGLYGLEVLLREAWDRYHLPLAVTEVHLACTREEQLRWLYEAWNTAGAARSHGIDVRAITPWALFGAFDWDSLLRRFQGHYESGAFDVRGFKPRPTALAGLVRDLASGREPAHPVIAAPGWWRRADKRFTYPPVHDAARIIRALPRPKPPNRSTRPVLIAGATGTLGYAFARLCHHRGISHRALTRRELDIADPAAVQRALDEYRPWAVVNAAGYVRVDDAERESELCMRENADAPAVLATECAARDVQLITFSSDLVFDGQQRERPYVESDPVAPLNTYGRSKAQAESRVLELLPQALVVRTSAFFGPWDEYNFITIALRELSSGRKFIAADDAWVSPTYVPDLVHTSLDLLIDGESGLWHLANDGALTWADLARWAAELAGIDPHGVVGRPTRDLNLVAPRPSYSVLGSERAKLLPSLETGLHCYLQDCAEIWNVRRNDRPPDPQGAKQSARLSAAA